MTDARIRLIVNADDLGWSQGVNEGIFDAHRSGILTSATLAANMPSAEAALAALPAFPKLGVGIHLNVCQGSALSQPGQEVLAGEGGVMNLTGNAVIARCLLHGRRTLPAIAAEMEAQIKWCLDHGLTPTHVDSHRHIHAWPAVFRLVADLCRRYHIRHVRRHRERLPWAQLPPAPPRQRRLSLVLNWLGGRCTRLAPELLTTNGSLGVAHTGRIDAEFLLTAIASLQAGVTEIMAHPGYAEDLPAEQTRLRESRRLENQALCDPRVKDALARRGIELVHYGQID